MKRVTAATLAVGTEVTDGQITDRNSAWISERLVQAGFEVVEHRAVPDEHAAIERALSELASRVDYFFVTGGLGPTSDDFTRDLIAKAFGRALEFDPGSWTHLSQLLLSRGITVREIQRQQCFFPQGARVLTNPAGTANAFTLAVELAGKTVHVYALPGPPTEIAAVWQAHIAGEIEKVVPPENREQLSIVRCLGRGESQIAEVVEGIVKGTGLRVGYRASMPYVEVKLWYQPSQNEEAMKILAAIEAALKKWVIGRDDDDLADILLDRLVTPRRSLKILDHATCGVLQERLALRLRERGLFVDLVVETNFSVAMLPSLPLAATAGPQQAGFAASFAASLTVYLTVDERENLWRLIFLTPDGKATTFEERPVFKYKVSSERGRRYITERCLVLLAGRF